MEDYSIYLHIPFCIHRCSYCDFNTYAGRESEIPEYVTALCKEMVLVSQAVDEPVPIHTIFLGGGTPSILPTQQHTQLLTTIRRQFNLLPEAEISLEANPGTVSFQYLAELRNAGYNRISFGMQSANPEHLRLLERQHDPYDVIEAVKWARQAGFKQINLDLIFGLPDQSLEQWQASLDFAIGLNPEHLSLYALTIETGTPLSGWVNHGLVVDPDADLSADMYDWSTERLVGAGYFQYEISNWAKTDPGGNLLACRHNLQYWRNQPYFGFGAGAHGYIKRLPLNNHGMTDQYQNRKGVRTENVLRIEDFINKITSGSLLSFPYSPANKSTTPIDTFTEMQETMMVGLRLTGEGVSSKSFAARFGSSMIDVFGKEIAFLIHRGLLEWAKNGDDSLRLTQRGRFLGNQVFMQFVGRQKIHPHQNTTTCVP